MSRVPLMPGNWKMHCTVAEAVNLARQVAASVSGLHDRQVMIAPPATALAAVCEAVRDSDVLVAGQNVAWKEEGAYTGEISPVMLQDVGASMAIIGHSERRHIFGETDATINQRMCGALAGGIVPILCVGETLDERENATPGRFLSNRSSLG